jgi:stearoyl-CoA desaturase (delta-9 desaturase)
MRDNRIIRSRHLHKLQRRHFIFFDVLPFLGTLVALGLLFYRPIGAAAVSLFFSMLLLTGLGLTVGYHRLFTHRAFSTGLVTSCAFIIMGSTAARGPMVSWVAMHWRHHELSDHEGDLHSPNLLLEALGLAWNVKVPSREKIALRLARQETHEALDLDHG